VARVIRCARVPAELTEPRVLVDNLAFPESPRWHRSRLWFCDWGAREIIGVDLQGQGKVVVRVESFPFCIDWLPDGHLLVVSGTTLWQSAPDGSLSTYADLERLDDHSWNDIVVDGRGNTYVNNIGFDFPGGEVTPGIIALVEPDGSAREVADDIEFPNGMVVTPDNSTLIVAESYGGRLTAFEIALDGSLSNRRTWADVDGGAPDGICLDAEGAIWYADVPNKRCVRVAEGGEVLQTIELDRGCFACMLGGPRGTTLFLTTNDWRGPASIAAGTRAGQVLAVDAPARHAGWP
jgi:sugar lactone lactonase YvrE